MRKGKSVAPQSGSSAPIPSVALYKIVCGWRGSVSILKATSLLLITVLLFNAFSLSIFSTIATAQTVGPSPPTITTTTNVNAGTTTVVGSTNIATTGATNATNVTGGTLRLDTTAGPAPGPITLLTANGNALQASGGTITVLNTINVQTGGGHAFLANGAASTITITNGTNITSTGVAPRWPQSAGRSTQPA